MTNTKLVVIRSFPDTFGTRWNFSLDTHAGIAFGDGGDVIFPEVVTTDSNGNVYVIGTFRGQVKLVGIY